MSQNTQKAYLVLEDGTYFEGKAIGKVGTTSGEIAFNTGMTGYQEVFTDPSYFGQLLVMTTDHIGNYGTRLEDAESEDIQISGLICKKYASTYSRNMASMSLNDYLIDHNLIGICDVDTREIVQYIREKGAMNAIISSEILDIEELKTKLADVPSMQGLELSSKVWTKEPYLVNEGGTFKVALLDLGSKKNIIRCLVERNCQVKVFPGDTSFEQMQEWNPAGYMISNGPGDPSVMPYAIDTVKKIVENNQKMFGICLGSQILAQAAGMKTYKLHRGHRGQNHPVKNLLTQKSEITSQNHGFAIDPETNPGNVEITHINLNDNTVEGIRIKGKDAFAVQYHPEANPGPHDSRYLFDDFVAMLSA